MKSASLSSRYINNTTGATTETQSTVGFDCGLALALALGLLWQQGTTMLNYKPNKQLQ